MLMLKRLVTPILLSILYSLSAGQVTLAPGVAGEMECTQMLALRRTSPEPDLVLLSPRPWEVFQRRTKSSGPVLLSGRMRVPAQKLEARILGKPASGKLDEAWFEVPMDAPTHAFNLTHPLPAGGWYRLELRARAGEKELATALVERFGVGEVFVGAGQSNSTNCGQFKTRQTSGMVSSFDGSSWRLADDPQPGPHDKTQGGSFWPAFGDAMYARHRVPIGVAVTGHGGTSVDRWQPGGDLFAWTMTRIHQLGPLGFRALLWHQGESDVGKSAEEYYQKMRALILASKEAAGWEFPWFVAQVSYHNPDKPSFATTREAQERLWKEGVALEGPDTDMLTGDHRDYEGKGIHFSPKGLKAHGEMWADKVSDHIERVLR